ncbi:MAG: Fe-S cluster assembly protein SufB [Candidatus Aenigmarchaeota archaeon]|nr:Fe-S cluster assembly protein SufB [Candidatus Aenigmarchaeota archaeon]
MPVSQELVRSKQEYRYGFHDDVRSVYETPKGLSESTVRAISEQKNEPEWMLEFRLKALTAFVNKPMPAWGADLSGINFDEIVYYIKPSARTDTKWEDVPEQIRKTFQRLGLPEAEQKFLGGVTAQYESEAVYHSINKDLEAKGVVFLSMDEGLKQYPELVKKYFGTVVPKEDNKFAALNSAVWSGGSFLYVPKGVHVNVPLQAYFRINAERMGQFERTLIIVDEGASVHYVEGCTAPTYSRDSLHAAVVEVIALKDAKVRYTTIQNWSSNVYNLVTKRAMAYEGATVEWIDGNLGSKVTMKYPSVILRGQNAKADILSIAFAGPGQHQDAGAKTIHLAPNTSSRIISKSVSMGGGRTTYRGLVRVGKGCKGVKSSVRCDALILDERSASDTVPYMEIYEDDVSIAHEATVGKISEEALFYLMSRGLKENEAMALIVKGFIEAFTKELPMEYAIELNRLIEMEMEGAVG